MPPRQISSQDDFAERSVATLHPDAPRAAGSLMSYRVSLAMPLLGRYYVSVVIGREARSRQRVAGEGQTRLSRTIIACVTLLTLAFGLFCGLYLIKSFSGINVLPGPSPLHALYALFHG